MLVSQDGQVLFGCRITVNVVLGYHGERHPQHYALLSHVHVREVVPDIWISVEILEVEQIGDDVLPRLNFMDAL